MAVALDLPYGPGGEVGVGGSPMAQTILSVAKRGGATTNASPDRDAPTVCRFGGGGIGRQLIRAVNVDHKVWRHILAPN